MLTNNEQKLRQSILWVLNIVYGERGNFRNSFENSHNILSLIVWNLQKKVMKNEVLCMLFTITQMYFNESGYVRLHSIMNIITENGAKMTHKNPQ